MTIDFDAQNIEGISTYRIQALSTQKRIVFDIQGLSIHNVTMNQTSFVEWYTSTPNQKTGSALFIYLP